MHTLLKNLQLKVAGLLLFCKIQPDAMAQTGPNRFDEEINYYRHLNDTASLPVSPIVFIGSSSIKNWIGFDTVYGHNGAINRGFGGSTLLDQIHFKDDILLAHNARQFVIYCGENDFASSSSITADVVFERYMELYRILRSKFPDVPVIAVSMKPSPSKLDMMQKIYAYNKLLQDYSLIDTTMIYADIFTPMLNPDGSPNRSYFFSDMLHMNRAGYAIWNAVIEPLLVKE